MADLVIILRAFSLAAEAHKYQKRKCDDSSYICHPSRVALFIGDRLSITDRDVIIAALFHDVVEDTVMSIEDIRGAFGDRVASIVAEVTDDRTLSAVERKRAQLSGITKKSLEAVYVKVADMYDNLSSLLTEPPPTWPTARIQGYFVWKKAIYVKGIRPLGNEIINAIMDPLFASTLKDGHTLAIPLDTDLDVFLEHYYASLSAIVSKPL